MNEEAGRRIGLVHHCFPAARTVMDAGIAYEAFSVRGADHREAISAGTEKKRIPVFGKKD